MHYREEVVFNQDTEYGLLVAQIHQRMLQFDGVENISVKHDVSTYKNIIGNLIVIIYNDIN